MPRYISDVDRWLSHECRLVKAGEEFSTEFPKVKVNGELQEMKLSSTLHLVEDEPKAKGKSKQSGDDLV